MKIRLSVLFYCFLFLMYDIFFVFVMPVQNHNRSFLNMLVVILIMLSLLNWGRELIAERKFFLLEPYIFLPIMYMLYALGPLTETDEVYHITTYIQYTIVQTLGLFGLLIGLELKRPSYKEVHIEIEIDYTYKCTTVLMLILSIASVVILIINFGGILSFIRIGYGVNKELALMRMNNIGGGFSWLILTNALFALWYLKNKNKTVLFCTVTLSIITVLYSLASASRGPIVYALIVFFTLYSYTIKDVSSRKATVLIFIGIFLSQFVSDARYWLLSASFEEMIQNTINVVKNSPERYLPWAASEFKSPCRSLLLLLENHFANFFWGEGYLYNLNMIIPGSTYIVKIGVDVAAYHTKTYYNQYLGTGMGMGFSPVSEAYMNLGTIGVFFLMMLYGVFSESLFKRLQEKKTIIFLLIFAGALPCLLIEGIRISSSTFMYKLLRLYLLPAIIYYLIDHLKIFSSLEKNIKK